MKSSQKSSIHLFGDTHTDPREEVKQRLDSVISEDAEALVLEHCVKADNGVDPSDWVLLKNPCLLLVDLIISPIQNWSRSRSNRITNGTQMTVAEEVAKERNLVVEYIDITWKQRLEQQPFYLTLISWLFFLSLLIGWLFHPLLSAMSVVLIPATALHSTRVYSKIREQEMADELIQLGNQYSEMVFFAGDSHIDPISKILENDLKIVEAPDTRP